MRIDNGDDAKSLFAQIADHARWVGKSLVIPRKRLVIILIVNVEPDRVGRNLPNTKILGDEAHFPFGIVAVTALVISEGPERRERHVSRERRVALDHFLRIGAVDEVVIERPSLRTE